MDFYRAADDGTDYCNDEKSAVSGRLLRNGCKLPKRSANAKKRLVGIRATSKDIHRACFAARGIAVNFMLRLCLKSAPKDAKIIQRLGALLYETF